MRRREFLGGAAAAVAQPDPKNILVVTAASGDYILAAGGTLAALIREGWKVNVAQFGNDEKLSAGLSPAQTRLANVEEARAAGRLLGVADTVYMGHKSGELGYTSSTEMRQQLFGLIRHFKPKTIFIPDPYVHYQEDRDQFWTGKMAEEAWGYSGGGTFANDLTRMGFGPYGAPEVYYYAVGRPYRGGEGGDGRARFVARDIGATLEQKITAAELLHTRNRLYALQVSRRLRQPPGDDGAAAGLVREYLTELAETIGRKHGFRHGEEFNHVGGTEGIPAYVLERAVPKR
ncbi:MAG: PIG-L family deacetylase [Acidobacteria bacterium]|nr:PIG-L family deacetylase [Acidobacteriota bacterium]